MKLSEWLEQSETTCAALAETLECDQSTIWRYANKKRVPDIKTAMAIERATNGAVTVRDFAG